MRLPAILTCLAATSAAASAQVTLPANPPPPDNGGSTGWGLYFDLTSAVGPLTVTHLRTASGASAGAMFDIEVLTFDGSGLTGVGGSVGSGPGSSMTGWTSLGIATATQGPGGSNDTSEVVDVPDIVVPAGQTVGVCLLYVAGAGPRYLGQSMPPYQVFSDGALTLTTGDSRTEPFTTGGLLFASRGLVGELVYAGGTLGTNYCNAVANSTGAPGRMRAEGSVVVSDNDLTLIADDLPNNAFTFFITGQTQGFVPNPAGSQGNLCLGGSIGRYVGPGQVGSTFNTGEYRLVVDLTLTPQPNGLVAVMPGESWSFQAWHRDSAMGTVTSNFTDGLELQFQ